MVLNKRKKISKAGKLESLSWLCNVIYNYRDWNLFYFFL